MKPLGTIKASKPNFYYIIYDIICIPWNEGIYLIILIYTLSMSNGVTLAKQMETTERLSNAVEVKVKIFRKLKRCTMRVF